MQTNSNLNQTILYAIHNWEAKHGQQPTWLQINTKHQEEFDTSEYDYQGHTIRIIYSDNVPVGDVRFGQGRIPQ